MSDKIIENNQVTIMGVVASGFTYSHEVFGEGFYMADVLVKRLSNSNDRIPLMISERLIRGLNSWPSAYIIRERRSRYPGSSVLITGMKNRKTAWCCLCL